MSRSAPGAGWHREGFRLRFRRPWFPDNLFGHLVATAVPGVEEWRDGAYRRTLSLPHGSGIVALTPCSDRIEGTAWLADARDLPAVLRAARRMLDLDADAQAMTEALAGDPALRRFVRDAPGRRVPGTPDGAELALRMVLGQQISTRAARTVTGRLVARHGIPVNDPGGGLTRLFPSPEVIAALPDEELGMPSARRASLRSLAAALADGSLRLTAGTDPAAAREQLSAMPGIGPWTAEGIAMRALGDPDAFPGSDLGVRQAMRALGLTAADARRWRPWRAYAVQYLWATGDHEINRMPPRKGTIS